MKNKRFLSKIFFAILTVLLVACSTSTKVGFLVGTETCSPPCWLDIQPGVTKIEQMVEVFQDYEQRGKGSFVLLDSGIYRWRSDKKNNTYIYSNNDGIVSTLDIDIRPSSISLSDVIEIFGKPSNLIAGKISDGYIFFSVYYPEQGLAFVVAGGNNFDSNHSTLNFMVEPTQVVIKSIFFQPSDVTSMVNLLYGVNVIDEALSDIQDWNGYGTYTQ